MNIVHLNGNKEAWAALDAALRASGVVGVDIETTHLEPHMGRIRLVQFACDDETAYILDMFKANPAERDEVGSIASDESLVKIAHHAKFEIAWLTRHVLAGQRARMWFCTELASRIVGAGNRLIKHSLKDTVQRKLGITLDKEMQLSDWSAPTLSEAQLAYAARDVLVLPSLRAELSKDLVALDLARCALIEFDAVIPLAEMEVAGLHLDREQWSRLLEQKTLYRNQLLLEVVELFQPGVDWEMDNPSRGKRPVKPKKWFTKPHKDQSREAHDAYVDHVAEYQRRLARHEFELQAWERIPKVVPAIINLNSPAQVKNALKNLTGIVFASTAEPQLAEFLNTCDRRIAQERGSIEGIEKMLAGELPVSGGFATLMKAQGRLAESERTKHILERLLEYRGAEKSVTSYGENYLRALDEQDRIHANFKQIEAETGRMSSGGGEAKLNLQNVPHDKATRSCFTAPRGRKLLIADYAQIELRLLAQMSRDRAFIASFKSGLDLHRQGAAHFFDLPFDDVTQEQRDNAKAVNFAYVYSAGANRISALTKTSVEFAKRVMDNYNEAYPGNALWLKKAKTQAMNQGFARTMSGRLVEFDIEFARAQDSFGLMAAFGRNGSNAPLQGTCSDMLKRAMKLVSDRLEGSSAGIVNVVHDELIVEVDESEADWAAEQLKIGMEEAGREYITVIPCPVEVKIASSWGEKK